MKKTLLIVFILLSTYIVHAALTEHWKIRLGEDTFCVPKRHSTLDQTAGPIFDIPGMDIGPVGGTLQVIIEPEEIQEQLLEYALNHGDLPANFVIHLSMASNEKISRIMRREKYRAALQLTKGYPEDFSKAHIQFDEKNQYYRVSSDISPAPFTFWKVLKIKPGLNAVVPVNLDDYYVARCTSFGNKTVGDENSSASCGYTTVIDNYLVRIDTTENNLLLKEKITAYAENLLERWRQNCQ